MGKLTDKIAEGRVLISDGAWGTFLHQKGLKVQECPESWNIERPADVMEIAQSYVDAGADIILTNSFGGSPFKLAGYGLQDQTFEFNKAAAEISKEAAGDKVLVLGSMGPTGKMVMMGEVPEEDLLEGMMEQARGLVAGGVDGIVLETMSDLEEARITIQAVKKCDKPGCGLYLHFFQDPDRGVPDHDGGRCCRFSGDVQGGRGQCGGCQLRERNCRDD